MAKRKYRRNTNAKQPSVQLSQCMIVKNEEKNIEKALSWGKGIVCEQIVVDTGSTDRTVEIAECMGAKVLHFDWINDFAAAKNYAIEQASGNWIAFLDADEYIEKEDATYVIPLLELVMIDPKRRRNDKAVCCPWIQLNDKGQPKEILEQERIFQNLPDVRYVGKIHESLSIEHTDVVYTNDFRIMHTGYTEESFITTGKASRNIELLRNQLAANPDDLMLKAYLAESLRAEAGVRENAAENPEEAARIDAEYAVEVTALYDEIFKRTNGGETLPPLLKKGMYEFYLRGYAGTAQIDPKTDDICKKAFEEYPKDPKFMCYYAMTLNKNGKHREALDVLKKCEDFLEKSMGSNFALTTKIMALLSAQMVLAFQALGDFQNVLKYAELMLLMDKNNLNILRPYIFTLMNQTTSLDDVIGVLGRVYDLSSKRDLLTIARAAKDCGAIALARRIIDVAAYLGDDV